MWLSKLLQLSPRTAVGIWWEKLLYTSKTKNWSKFISLLSFENTSGSFDETMLFTVVVSALIRSSLIFLVVELTKQ